MSFISPERPHRVLPAWIPSIFLKIHTCDSINTSWKTRIRSWLKIENFNLQHFSATPTNTSGTFGHHPLHFPGGSDSGSICPQGRRPRFYPWIRKTPWRREWLHTLVFLPGEFHGQRSLVGCSPRGHKESDRIEGVGTHTHTDSFIFIPWCLKQARTISLLISFHEEKQSQ